MLSSKILLPSQSVVFLALPIPCDASVTCMMSIAMAWVCTPSTLFTSQCTTSALMKQYGERPFCSESSWIPVLNHSKWHMWEHGLTDSSFWLQTPKSLLGKKKRGGIKIQDKKRHNGPRATYHWLLITRWRADVDSTLVSYWEFLLW